MSTVIKAIAAIGMCFASTAALAECWTVTDVKGISMPAREGYKQTEEAFSSTVFLVNTGTENPRISLRGNPGSYEKGNFLSISDSSVAFLAPGIVEVINIDEAQGVAYMTSSRNGTGQFDRGAVFAGSASRGCK